MKKFFEMGLIMLVMIILLAFSGCDDSPSEPTYTVWTDVVYYSEYYSLFGSLFGTLDDGYFIRYQFSSSEWNAIYPSLTNEGKHQWTESQIRNYFIGRGFGNNQANQETAWFMTVDHGFNASREGQIVDIILK